MINDHTARLHAPRLLAVGAAFAVLALNSAATIATSCLGASADHKETLTVQTRLAGVPALVRIPTKIGQSPIVLWHGFGPPDSERTLMEALPLDEVPAIKVYLGLPLFGDRLPPGGNEELVRRQTEDLGRLLFEPTVVGAAGELPSVIDALIQQRCLTSGQPIGVFGFSGGGAAALLALANSKVRIDTAVISNTSIGLKASVDAFERVTQQRYAWTPYTRELAQRADAIGRAADIAAHRPALLIIHGSEDAMLSPESAASLYDALAPWYRKAGDAARLALMLADGVPHAWANSSRAADLRRSMALWYAEHLSSTSR